METDSLEHEVEKDESTSKHNPHVAVDMSSAGATGYMFGWTGGSVVEDFLDKAPDYAPEIFDAVSSFGHYAPSVVDDISIATGVIGATIGTILGYHYNRKNKE